MKFEYEKKVMQAMYLIKMTRNRDITMKGITQQTGIPKTNLQKILPRLEKRGWIERYETWDAQRITILWNTHDFNFKEVLAKAKGSYESRRAYAKKELRRALLPKKTVAYRIFRFPYIIGDEEGVTVTKGYAQRWRKASKESKQQINEYLVKWKEDKKAIMDKIKRLDPRIRDHKTITPDQAKVRKEYLEKELVIHKRKRIIGMVYKPI